jgi:hypothetical protein
MQRKGPGDRVEKLRAREDNDTFLVLRRKAMRWAADNVETLKAAQPRIPEELNDRAADNWEPLLSIAELAGCDWPEAARQAARALNGASEADSQSIRVELLADIRQVFAKLKVDRIFSATLVTELVATKKVDGRPMAKPDALSKPDKSRDCCPTSESARKRCEGKRFSRGTFASHLLTPSPAISQTPLFYLLHRNKLTISIAYTKNDPLQTRWL